jgi:hypothetical protein
MAEEIRGPIPPDYHYERVVDGVVVETIPGTGGATGSGLGALNTTTIDDAGNVQPPPIRRADPVAPPAPGDLDQLSGDSFDAASTSYNNTGGYSRNPNYGGGYRGSGYGGSSGGGYGGDGGGGYGSTVPRYADGTTHPFFGGPSRVPGGQFAAQDQGFDNRQQLYLPTGAAAGPVVTRAPRTPEGGNTGNYGSSGSGGGSGGGGGASDLYYKLKAKLEGAAGGGSTETTSTKQYRRQARRSDRAWDRYNEELYNPDPLPVHGWAKKQGFKPGSVELALDDPTTILSSVFPGYERRNTNAGTWFDDIPMVDLALAAFGTDKKGLTTKTPIVRPPAVLRKQGVKPIKPEEKRILDPSAVVNAMAPMYEQIAADTGQGGTWFDTQELLGNLADAKRKSTVRKQFELGFEEDPGSAQQQAIRLVQSVLGTMPMNAGTLARMQSVEQAASNLGASTLRRKPKKASRFINQLAGVFLE